MAINVVVVEPVLNTLRKDIFCDFVKYRQSFFLSLVKNNY